MNTVARLILLWVVTVVPHAMGSESTPDATRDLLVTYKDTGVKPVSGGFGAPYSNRKRYTISATARRDAAAVEKEYSLTPVDHWPIKSLSVYCFVYRVSENQKRSSILEKLKADKRIESVQLLQEFETSASTHSAYNDTYANLQHGIDALGLMDAHRYSLGSDIRVAIVDSQVDARHEDLTGRIDDITNYLSDDQTIDMNHATAVASIIGAHTNNEKGIAGVAPDAKLSVFASCWANEETNNAVCDTFSLAKAFDTIIEDPPEVLNLSLIGPHDPLLARLLEVVLERGVIVIAARPMSSQPDNHFPSSMAKIIGVSSAIAESQTALLDNHESDELVLYAPGEHIMVAIPGDGYDFRSGSSLATAHISGIVALLLAASPNLAVEEVYSLLAASQTTKSEGQLTVNACTVLQLANSEFSCLQVARQSGDSEI